MNKMKKILAVLCIAIAVVMCLPNLKFLSRAGFGDYFDSVKVEYGGSVTLIPDLSRLPSDFEIGQVKWWTGEYDSDINGYTCTLKNVTKTDSYSYVVASIQNKDNFRLCFYYFDRIRSYCVNSR